MFRSSTASRTITPGAARRFTRSRPTPLRARPPCVSTARSSAIPFPLLLDPKLSLARGAGATVMPEAAVLSPSGHVLYLGRIDDRVVDFGKARLQARQHDLREALDAVLAGKPVAHSRTRAVGCAIPFGA